MVVTKGTGLQTPPRLCVVPVILPAAQTVVATGPRTPAAGRLAALTEPRGGVAVMTGEDRNKGSCCWTCIWILKKRVSEWTLYSVGALTPLSSSPHSSAHGRTGQVYRSHTLHCVVPHTTHSSRDIACTPSPLYLRSNQQDTPQYRCCLTDKGKMNKFWIS